ncbi:energy transducer TonB [Niveispirillum sp.]|uniref:energy transducer TonB n=1 Tax=Niveispirillum sp. TaxID=1917217 RepID=UPI001B4404FA|nr:energy transducer TonB [Niveispirillum sp.]MBP7336215.1 TonB family protein [Niveispirillum sp.]
MSYLSQSSYRRQQPQSSGRLVGIAVVVLLHVGLIYALMTGLARSVVQVITDPIKTEIIEEIAPPPEETPPPPPPPKFDTPPPPFIPPPEVNILQPPPPTSTAIQATTAERPPVVQPPTRVQAPPAPPPTGGKIDVKSLAKNRPEYPAQSIRLEEAGTTVMRLYCNADGRISDATIEKSSGFDRLDQAWMKEAKRGRWRCEPPTVDGKPQGAWLPSMVPLTFRLEDAR